MAKAHYVDNKEFTKELTEYRKAVKKAKREGLPRPQIPRYVAECIMKIAEHFTTSYKFMKYTWRDDMVADAVENCIRYIDNFDPKISKNAFAYFSRITYFSCLRTIQKEKKELYVKYKSTEISGILDEFELNETDDGESFRQFELYDNISEFIQKYEESQRKKKEKKAMGIEKFVDENNK